MENTGNRDTQGDADSFFQDNAMLLLRDILQKSGGHSCMDHFGPFFVKWKEHNLPWSAASR